MTVVEVTGLAAYEIAPQIPRAESLEPGAQVLVRPKRRGWLSKVLGGKPHDVGAAMASALLARGYVAIAAAPPEEAPGAIATAPSEAP